MESGFRSTSSESIFFSRNMLSSLKLEKQKCLSSLKCLPYNTPFHEMLIVISILSMTWFLSQTQGIFIILQLPRWPHCCLGLFYLCQSWPMWKQHEHFDLPPLYIKIMHDVPEWDKLTGSPCLIVVLKINETLSISFKLFTS